MKNMQNFYKWLSSVNESSMPDQRRLAALTRLNHNQLSNAASALTWDIWSGENITVVS